MTEPRNQVSAVADLRSVVVEIGGKPITITPLKVGRIPAFRAAGGERLLALGAALPTDPAVWFATLSQDNGQLLDALSVASGVSRAEIDDLYPDVLVTLIAAVAEVNLDFFVQRLIPALAGARRDLAVQLGEAAVRMQRSMPAAST